MTETTKQNAQALLDAATPGIVPKIIIGQVITVKNLGTPENIQAWGDLIAAAPSYLQAYILQCDVVEKLKNQVDILASGLSDLYNGHDNWGDFSEKIRNIHQGVANFAYDTLDKAGLEGLA